MHLQTFGWADFDALLASDAGIGNDHMDLFGRANNGIGRTDFKTAGAARAGGFADSGNQ